MKKVIISVVGKDAVGIIAKVCMYLAEHNCNILDISQTITGGYFNMMMVVDFSAHDKQFTEMCEDLNRIGEEIGVVIHVQREELFEKMYRI